MKEITKEEFERFVRQEFPNTFSRYEDGYCFIQAGSCLGENLHYELNVGKIHLDIEGPDWRPIRDYLRSHVVDSRVKDSYWRRKGCRWTLDKIIDTNLIKVMYSIGADDNNDFLRVQVAYEKFEYYFYSIIEEDFNLIL